MVAHRRKKRIFRTEDEAARAALAAVPVSDEDPALFWGPDWKQALEEAEKEMKSGPRRIFFSEEEFFAALDELSSRADT
jgi:hypothetical protein